MPAPQVGGNLWIRKQSEARERGELALRRGNW